MYIAIIYAEFKTGGEMKEEDAFPKPDPAPRWCLAAVSKSMWPIAMYMTIKK
jgi:hypothetical protein